MDQSYWKEQLYKYRMCSLTRVEEELLWDAWADTANAEGWKQIMGEMFREQAPGEEYLLNDWEPVLQAVFNSDRTAQPAVVRRMPIGRRYAVAAVILTLLGTGTWWMVRQRMATAPPVVQTTKSTDVPAPVTNRATITLAGGQQVSLDSAGNGALAQQGNVQVVKMANGQVAYKVENLTNRKLLYNTLTNPRGSQVMNLTLADGTKVWLNAESSIRYPVVFTGQDRTVEMTGEAYLEVAKDKTKPFHVNVHGMNVEVLGTHFNINSYEDEGSPKATLMEGSVRVTVATSPSVGVNTNTDKLSVVLKPGQQAQVVGLKTNNGIGNANNGAGQTSVLNNVDTAAVMAWKNGLFAFHNADLPSVMRQLARWYNIDVSYEGHIPQEKFQFNGKMGKDLTLNNVLDLLTNAQVHYTIEAGNKLVIRP